MISNDKEFKDAFREYLKSKGINERTDIVCDGIECKDCIFKDLGDCIKTPFKEIEIYEKCIASYKKKIEALKQEINVMNKWVKEDILRKKLLGVCTEIRSNWGNLLCSGIKCDNCIFNGKTDNLHKWMKEQKNRGEE